MQLEDKLPKFAYNMKEAQRITGLGRTTLWKAVKRGQLERCYIAGVDRVFFTLEALRNFMTRDGYKKVVHR